MAKLTITVINYNSQGYIKRCLESILEQTFEDFEVIFIDNASKEREDIKFMKDNYGAHAKITIVENQNNRGYAHAANQGIELALNRGSKYVSIVNPDIIFEPDYYEKVINKMDAFPEASSITGKIYKYDFANDTKTNIIDSTGLFAYKNRRIVDEGQGTIDEGQFNQEKEVFGVSGACPVYRIEALEHVKIMDQYFDEDFFMYKEDTDLAWRFLLYGWKNLYIPDAIAHHGRGTGVYPRFSTREIIKNRKNLNKFQKQLSFRNQHIMQTKNEMWGNYIHHFFPILTRKILTPIYMTFFEPYLWKSYLQYLNTLPNTYKKRKIIMANKALTPKEMRKWFKSTSKRKAS